MSPSAPYFALLFNAMVWGLSWWPFKTMHAAGLAAPWATSLIYGALVLGTTLLVPRAWKVLLAQPALWLLALSSGLTNVAFNTASSTGDVVRVILLFYLMPAWAVLLAWRFLGERPTPQGLLRLALAFGGMALVIVPAGASWHSLTADIALPDYLALFGGFCFAATNVILRRTNDVPGTSRMLAMFLGCTLMGLATATVGYQLGMLHGLPALQTSWVLCAVGMAMLVSVGNWALQYGAARLPTATTSLVMLSEVLFATLSAWLLGATELTERMLLGGVLIISGALLAALQGRRRKA
jgi:drug/metabolite transporter (DMT)-like permease